MLCPGTLLFLMKAGWSLKTVLVHIGGLVMHNRLRQEKIIFLTPYSLPKMAHKFDPQAWTTSLTHGNDPREWPASLTYLLDLYEISQNTFFIEAHQTIASE